MVRVLFLLLGLAMANPVWALTQVSASIDKNPVTVKESIVLTVIADDDVNADALDTSPLLDNFIVGRTSVSTQTSMVNFKTSRTTKWTTLIIPKREGEVTIPALIVEDKATAPIKITVLSANDPTAQRQQDLFITAQASANDIYVQQMITLTVKLHFSAELKRGSLSEPTLTGATITQVGKDQESETIINGRRFRVIERSYAITPQESGEFVLSSPMFSGEIMVQSSRRSNFLSFGETKPVSVVGDQIPINVRPIPDSFDGQWLPSELLTLHQEWQPDATNFKVGEPITRTITLTAAGVSSEQLPAINFNLPKGLKVYPDQPELHSSLNKGRLISQSVSNFAIVASQAGEFFIPALEIPWWNTVTNRMEIATLPAQSITVAPNDEIVSAPTSSSPRETIGIEPQTIIVEKTPWLQWLFLGLWITTCLAWALQYTLSRRQSGDPKNESTQSVNNLHLALLAACKKHNGNEVNKLLIPWANSVVPEKNITTIGQAKQHFNLEAFDDAVDCFYSHFYGNKTNELDDWKGEQLLKAIIQIQQQKNKKVEQAQLSINP